MQHKIVKIVYKNKQGQAFNGYFIKAINGLVPIHIDDGATAEPYKKISQEDAGFIDIELWKNVPVARRKNTKMVWRGKLINSAINN